MSLIITEAKAVLRKQVRERLASISPTRRAVESAQLCARIRTTNHWLNARTILLFAPLPDEPDIWLLLTNALAEGKRTALPFFDGEQQRYSARLIQNTATDTQIGRFGIREPKPDCPAVPLNQLDLVLVPGVAFDTGGRRLGRGRGFYDRLLALAGGVKCGVAFDEQLVDAIPAERHDICLDHILTPLR